MIPMLFVPFVRLGVLRSILYILYLEKYRYLYGIYTSLVDSLSMERFMMKQFLVEMPYINFVRIIRDYSNPHVDTYLLLTVFLRMPMIEEFVSSAW